MHSFTLQRSPLRKEEMKSRCWSVNSAKKEGGGGGEEEEISRAAKVFNKGGCAFKRWGKKDGCNFLKRYNRAPNSLLLLSRLFANWQSRSAGNFLPPFPSFPHSYYFFFNNNGTLLLPPIKEMAAADFEGEKEISSKGNWEIVGRGWNFDV